MVKPLRKGVSQLRRYLSAILVCGVIVTVMGAAVPPAHADPPPCNTGAPSDNGCKQETETTKETGNSSGTDNSGDFTETETQRGNTDAKGTEPGTTECKGPSGKPLRPDHPQCQ